MDDNPQDGGQALVSLWQNSLIGLKAERIINWRLRNPAACVYISGVKF